MKTYALVGVGARSLMYTDALSKDFKDYGKLTAICDCNAGRLEICKRDMAKIYPNLKSYPAADFSQMIADVKPDAVIVCSKDSTHDEYICKSMEMGCDAICEKPMTIDENKCQRIIDTVKKTGKKLRVTFNYRYSPSRAQIKEILMSGVIGKVLSVEFKWMLDTNHGADYYRRWHRNKANSGGLLVHKATHHFDLVNWWLSSYPESVSAKGGKVFYNAEQAKRYGLQGHATRCCECPVSQKCNYFLDLAGHPVLKELYLDNEKYDGYQRDRCVFGDDIDIEDSMNLAVRYNSGAYLSYSLNSFSPWEGYHIVFNGTKGRLEHYCQESSYISGSDAVQGTFQPETTWIKIFPHFCSPYEVTVDEGKGSHGGGDGIMLNDIFGNPEPDPLRRSADYVQGAYAILTGIAANKSMSLGKDIKISDLVHDLPAPDFVLMTEGQDIIPYFADTKRISGGQISTVNVPSKISAPQ